MSIDLIKEISFTFEKASSRGYPIKNYGTMQMTSHFLQIHHPKPNPYCIAKSKQRVALASTRMPTKQSSCVLNRKESSPLKVANL